MVTGRIGTWMTSAAVVATAIGAVGCGSDSSEVSVELYGWLEGEFLESLADYPEAEELEIQVTKPAEGTELMVETFSIDDGSADFPEVEGEEGLRMDFSVYDADGQVLAGGSTPVFDTGEDAVFHAFWTQISQVDDFAPVGARFSSGGDNGDEWYAESRLDDVSLDDYSSIGRVGHTAHLTESGKVLVVGGGQLSSDYEPGHKPSLDKVFDDIQLFDPATGHFTELAGEFSVEDDALGQDRLEQARAFHTVTPLGGDRFLVAGGFALSGDATRPQDSMELIDLNADEGDRIQSVDAELSTDRGMHTATRRTSDGHVVVAGGIGTSGDDIVDTVEIIDPDAEDVVSNEPMSTARVGHASVLLEDEETIWIIGGRDSEGASSSTEVVTEDGLESSVQLDRARYGVSAIHLGEGGNNQVLILGGFTGSAGATSSYEFGNPLQFDDVFATPDYNIDAARGQPELFELPQSDDIVVIGGYDQDRHPQTQAERFAIDVTSAVPLNPTEPAVGSMYETRSGSASEAMDNGRILVVGGSDAAGSERDTAEYFNPHDPVGR